MGFRGRGTVGAHRFHCWGEPVGRVHTMEIALCNIENGAAAISGWERGPVDAVACPRLL